VPASQLLSNHFNYVFVCPQITSVSMTCVRDSGNGDADNSGLALRFIQSSDWEVVSDFIANAPLKRATEVIVHNGGAGRKVRLGSCQSPCCV
jgi:hypothetical protein